ncbi:hypothetical protein CANARDRAFT_191208, partial [[Candida] arabinofermentans NRRL YB-2248]
EKALFYDGHEGFFEQQKLKNKKPSNNTMAMAPELTYDEFHNYNSLLDLICDEQIENLNKFYKLQYTQWLFELQQGFNLAFYGIGSKRLLLLEFIQKFLMKRFDKAKCFVVNGYNPEFHIRNIIEPLWAMFGKKVKTSTQWHESIAALANEFKSKPNKKTIILVNNIDGESLRSDKYQRFMSEISKISQVYFICTMDNLNTPLFWNSSLAANFNFIWHNVSTFKSYSTEISFKDPLNIGKSKAFVGSSGVKHLLSSLTVNARRLFKSLLLQQLDRIDTTLITNEDMERRSLLKGTVKLSLNLKDFYQSCLSGFITSNEMNFRSLLREFIDHKMTVLMRDASGTEILYVPFTIDEIEKLLDEEL